MALVVTKLNPELRTTPFFISVKCGGEVFEGVLKGSAFQLTSVRGQKFAEVGDYQWYIFDNIDQLRKLSRQVKRRYNINYITIGEYQLSYKMSAYELRWWLIRQEVRPAIQVAACFAVVVGGILFAGSMLSVGVLTTVKNVFWLL